MCDAGVVAPRSVGVLDVVEELEVLLSMSPSIFTKELLSYEGAKFGSGFFP